eukprot:TRINITY_DN92778_c0_g1_i1.p1 TRINITY_DN92778_c0_g1~~TRINITY_DN92778_c0_g1_i1.p1  ORF type:complete len:454 (-),score=109.32 TRINITY_DN92778_c0_g1_i1:23-1354(-)
MLHSILTLCATGGSSPATPVTRLPLQSRAQRLRPRAFAVLATPSLGRPSASSSSSASSASGGRVLQSWRRAKALELFFPELLPEGEEPRQLQPQAPADDPRMEALWQLDVERSSHEDAERSIAACLSACAATLNWKPARRLLLTMHSRQIAISASHMVTALQASRKNWDAALRLLRWAEGLGVDLTIEAYNLVFEALACEKQWEWAVSLLEELRQSSLLVPDAETYVFVARACQQAGQWRWAVKVARLAQEADLCDIRTWRLALIACEQAQETAWVLRLLRDMQIAEVSPDRSVFSTAICSSGKARLWLRSVELLEESRQLSKMPSDAAAFQASLEACAQASSWEQAVLVLGMMEAEKLTPGAMAFRAAACACEEAQQTELSGQLEEKAARSDAEALEQQKHQQPWLADRKGVLASVAENRRLPARSARQLTREELDRLQCGF